MSLKYEKLYKNERNVLGQPTQEFVDFFNSLKEVELNVLDLGCGQGRDALFIARLGHSVFGVDISPSGIAQMLDDAMAEKLDVKAECIDVVDFKPSDSYGIVLIDRTLHMLAAEDRLRVLSNIETSVEKLGYILIADENKNLQAMRDFFSSSQFNWEVLKDKKGFLFLQRM